jgi:hypothetical protein
MEAVVFNFWFKTFERALVQSLEELKYQCKGESSKLPKCKLDGEGGFGVGYLFICVSHENQTTQK